jgi:hypothetical protein
MKKVVRLTESDIERLVQKIILEEQKFSNRKKITENVRQLITNQELEGEELDEGFKELLIAAGILAGTITGYGQTQKKLNNFAQQRLDKVITMTQSIENNKSKEVDFVKFYNQTAEELGEKGYKTVKIDDAEDFINTLKKNSKENLKNLELDSDKDPDRGGVKERLSTNIKTFELKNIGDYRAVKSLIKNRGYSISSFKEISDTIYIFKGGGKDTIITVPGIPVSLDFDGVGDMFPSGEYDIDGDALPKIKSKIQSFIDSVKNGGGEITSLNLEASTDAQGLSSELKNDLKSKGYSADNSGLAKARVDALKKVLKEVFESNGIPLPKIGSQELKPEQGGVKKQVYSAAEKIKNQKFRTAFAVGTATFAYKSTFPVEPEDGKDFKIVKKRVVELVNARISEKHKGGGGGGWTPGEGPPKFCGVDGCTGPQ